jgi:hypothetical protein
MGEPRKCLVTFRDGEGVEHAVELTAESLYEATILALDRFRRCAWSREATFETATLKVEVWERSTIHRVSVADLDSWLKRPGGKPHEVALRNKLRQKVGS